MKYLSNPARNHGFSMVEILVTLIVLSIGLLGLAAMQANSMQNTHGAYLRTQATYLAYDMLDRMRANMADVNINGYDDIDTGAHAYTDPGCITTNCTPNQLTTYDALQWATNLSTLLPAGQGNIAAMGNNVFIITVIWGDPNANGTTNFSMTSQL